MVTVHSRNMLTRRELIELSAAILSAPTLRAAKPKPWYRTTLRWGQTNITERDPVRYDIDWWREYWKQTAVEGVIINAGGIVAYYPSKFPLHRQAEFLKGRDLYGELVDAARKDGLAVVARMDSSGSDENFFHAHPEWFARNKRGEPYTTGPKFISCINGPYFDEYIPSVLREIVERTHPDGFADNSWSGLPRNSICYCDNCARKFKDYSGEALPAERDWDNETYRQWIEWSYRRRLEVWGLNNRTTKAAGGPNCIWMGMNSGSITSESNSFRDLKEICARSEMLLLDHQSRTESTGFQQNGDAGKLVHGLMGWDKLAPESMALYQAPSHSGEISFRVSSKPALEARMWMIEGIAGGIQPWWHHVGAYHEDRRMYHAAQSIFQWHKVNQQYLVNREPIAAVGVVWSQRNTDYFGRDNAAELVDLPYRGITQALLRARIPYLPVNVDHVERDGTKFAALILPNVGALSGSQCDELKKFVDRGGSLFATGATSLYNESGDPRTDFGLANIFGAHAPSQAFGRSLPAESQTYLRLSPELRGKVWGPKAPDEPPASGERHPVLGGFEETDVLPFGGTVEAMRLDGNVNVPLTFVPAFPGFPPEAAWMRTSKTEIAALVLRESGKSRIAYMPADIDRMYGRENLPDHAMLLANIVRWLVGDGLPIEVHGPGLIDVHLYRQENRIILHLVNLSNEAAWRAPLDELIRVGPLRVELKLPPQVIADRVQLLVSGGKASLTRSGQSVRIEINSVADHEVLVIE